MTLSVYPLNKVDPSELQANEIHEGLIFFFDFDSGTNSAITDLVCKFQILIDESVAAHNQYLFGEKQSEWITLPASSEYKCSPLFKSHNIAVPSFPPLAQSELSGETVTELIYPVCPIKFFMCLQSNKLQTLTTLSQPPEMISGWGCCFVAGENLTHETQPWCPSSVRVNLQTPTVFHNFKVLSLDPETIWRLSELIATDKTSLSWLSNLLTVCPLFKSQRRKFLSHDDEIANCPSEETTTSETKCECLKQ